MMKNNNTMDKQPCSKTPTLSLCGCVLIIIVLLPCSNSTGKGTGEKQEEGKHNEKRTRHQEKYCRYGDDTCEKNTAETDQQYKYTHNFHIGRPSDAQKEGHIKRLTLSDGRLVERRTISTLPLIFEILNFLSEKEIEYLIGYATQTGLESGHTERKEEDNHELRIYDLDNDRKLTQQEMRLILENNYDIYFKPQHIRQMYKDLNLDPNGDGHVTEEELQTAVPNTKIFSNYVNHMARQNPSLKGRNSLHAFIFPDKESHHPVLNGLLKNVQSLTGLPQVLLEKSDLQVVKYEEGGHYNVHLDTGRRGTAKIKCCHRFANIKPCRICRWATLLLYLNDVEEGGETVFPLAGQRHPNVTDFHSSHKADLHLHCDEVKLKVKPKKGKAILWYNHKPSSENTEEWIGNEEEDMTTQHGSCPVRKGVKWIANFWIKVTENREWDLTPVQELRHKGLL